MELVKKPSMTFEEIQDPTNSELKISGRGEWGTIIIRTTEDLSMIESPFNITIDNIKLSGIIPIVKFDDLYTCNIDHAELLA